MSFDFRSAFLLIAGFARAGARFGSDRSGNVAMMFGLMAIALVLFVGGAVDIGRWLHARSQTAAAVDAAVLAGARALQTNGGDIDAAMAAARALYEQNVATRLELNVDTISFTTNAAQTEVTAAGRATIATPFLSLANVHELPLAVFAVARRAIGSASGSNKVKLEVSLMLDITGSMAGSKIDSLKSSAKQFVDILIPDTPTADSPKIALAPFSSATNTGTLSNVIATGPSSRDFPLANGQTRTFRLAGNCASERTGTQRYTDAAPSSARVGPVYTRDGRCPLTNPVVPLTDSKTALKTAIDAFQANGPTGGQFGTAWAWYLISPNWNAVLPSASRPFAYSHLSETHSNGMPTHRKVAILMTDGEYNTQYCSTGILDRNSSATGNGDKGNCTAPNGSSTSQARQLCSAMKAKGIVVYTIGFDLGGNTTAITTLRQCATSPDHAYNADVDAELQAAYADIALKEAKVYLSE